MNEKVKEFIESKQKEISDCKAKKKAEKLIDLGFCEKVYSPTGKQSEEYPKSEWDYESQTSKWYKEVPYEVTDEEYEELLKYARAADAENDASSINPVAAAIQVIAWLIYIGGTIGGLAVGGSSDWLIGIIVIASAFVSGTMFLGFGEIIKLLHAIKNK